MSTNHSVGAPRAPVVPQTPTTTRDSSIPAAVVAAVEDPRKGAIAPRGAEGGKIVSTELDRLKQAITQAFGTGPVPQAVVDYIDKNIGPAPKSKKVENQYEYFIAELRGRVPLDLDKLLGGSPVTEPDLPPAPPTTVTPPVVTGPGLGFKIDFERIDMARFPKLQNRAPIKSYAEYFSAEDESGQRLPFAALGGPNAIPGATMEEKEKWCQSRVIGVDLSKGASADQPFAKLFPGIKEFPYVTYGSPAPTSMPSPDFLLAVGCYHPNIKLGYSRSLLLQAAANKQAHTYLSARKKALGEHHISGAHMLRPVFQNGKATQRSAESSYMDHGRFNQFHQTVDGEIGDYHTLLAYNLKAHDVVIGGKTMRLTDHQVAGYKVAMGAVDSLVSMISDITAFDANFQGGQSMRDYHDVLAFAGLGYLACVLGRDEAKNILASDEKWRNFCSEAGYVAAVNWALWAPPVPEGIELALNEFNQQFGQNLDTKALAKQIYETFWRDLNQGKYANNGNPVTETFRWHQLAADEIRPVHKTLGVNPADMPNGGLAFPKFTVASYFESNVVRAFPMDYTASLEERTQAANARAIAIEAFVPDVLARAGFKPLDKPERSQALEQLRKDFLVTVKTIQSKVMQSTAAEAYAAIDPLIARLDRIVLTVPQFLPKTDPFPHQSHTLPPGVLVESAGMAQRSTYPYQGLLQPELAFIAVDKSIVSKA